MLPFWRFIASFISVIIYISDCTNALAISLKFKFELVLGYHHIDWSLSALDWVQHWLFYFLAANPEVFQFMQTSFKFISSSIQLHFDRLPIAMKSLFGLSSYGKSLPPSQSLVPFLSKNYFLFFRMKVSWLGLLSSSMPVWQRHSCPIDDFAECAIILVLQFFLFFKVKFVNCW